MEHKRRIRSYVLRQGRMSNLQRKAYQTLKEGYVVPLSGKKVEVDALFGNDNDLVVEIGFGMGIATAVIAEQNRETNFLGIEVHTPGVGKLLSEIKRLGLFNVRIIQDDAVQVMELMMADQSLAGIHVFFPDPWPKKKHHKRRIINPPFLQLCCRKLQPRGYIYMVTDWEPYASLILDAVGRTDALENPYNGYAEPQRWRPRTRFETRGLKEKREIYEIYAIRKKA